MINLCRLLLASVLGTIAASAQELTWAELVRRPEFWPTRATMKEAFRLPGSNSIIAGQTVVVASLRDGGVEIETPDGRGTFLVRADGTDVLAVARESWRRLSPDQRALTYAALFQRRDLWPYRVKLLQTVRLKTGTLNSGESVVLKDVEGGNLLVASVASKAIFTLPPGNTDLMESARRLLQHPGSAPGRITEDVSGKLIDPLTGRPAALPSGSEPRTFVFYRGAAWSEPSRQFTPALVKWHRETKSRRPHFAVIYISGDKSLAEITGFARQLGFTWPTVTLKGQPDLQLVNRLFTENIPQLVVTDRHGNLLIDSARIGPAAALAQLDALAEKN
jgi:hypothetical protein